MNTHVAVNHMFATWNEAARTNPDRFQWIAPPRTFMGVIKTDLHPSRQMCIFVGRDANWLRKWNLLLTSIKEAPTTTKYYLDVLFEFDRKTKQLKVYQYINSLIDDFTQSVFVEWNRHVVNCGGLLEPERESEILFKDIRAFITRKYYAKKVWEDFMRIAKANPIFNGKEALVPKCEGRAIQRHKEERDRIKEDWELPIEEVGSKLDGLGRVPVYRNTGATYVPNLRSIFRDRGDRGTILEAVVDGQFDVEAA